MLVSMRERCYDDDDGGGGGGGRNLKKEIEMSKKK